MDITNISTLLHRQWIPAFVEKTKRLVQSTWKLILVPSAFIFITFLIIYSLKDYLPFHPQRLTQDPLATTDLPFYYGVISNLGIMLWASAAAYNVMGAVLLRDDPRKVRFLLASAAFVTWLCLDDMLMFHERLFPHYFHIHEYVVYIGYLFIIVAYLLYFLRDIYAYTEYTLLVAALAALSASIVIDQFWGFAFGEDGAKFLGIFLWMLYYFRTVTTLIKERMTYKQVPSTGRKI